MAEVVDHSVPGHACPEAARNRKRHRIEQGRFLVATLRSRFPNVAAFIEHVGGVKELLGPDGFIDWRLVDVRAGDFVFEHPELAGVAPVSVGGACDDGS